MVKKKEAKNSETDSEEKSEERVNFENALKAIFSLTPDSLANFLYLFFTQSLYKIVWSLI